MYKHVLPLRKRKKTVANECVRNVELTKRHQAKRDNSGLPVCYACKFLNDVVIPNDNRASFAQDGGSGVNNRALPNADIASDGCLRANDSQRRNAHRV